MSSLQHCIYHQFQITNWLYKLILTVYFILFRSNQRNIFGHHFIIKLLWTCPKNFCLTRKKQNKTKQNKIKNKNKQTNKTKQKQKTHTHTNKQSPSSELLQNNSGQMCWGFSFNLITHLRQMNTKWQSFGCLIDTGSNEKTHSKILYKLPQQSVAMKIIHHACFDKGREEFCRIKFEIISPSDIFFPVISIYFFNVLFIYLFTYSFIHLYIYLFEGWY